MAIGGSFIYILYLIVPIVMLVSIIMVHQGKPLWATWLMLVGASLLFIGIIGMATSLYYIFNNRLGGSEGLIYTACSGIFSFGGILSYSIGMFGLHTRWGLNRS